MSKFSDRIFGTNVDPDVLKIFNNLQKGSFEQNPNEPIVENQDYLGDRTTFARMWTASLISGSIEDEEGNVEQDIKVDFHVVNDNRGESYEPNDSIGDGINTELSHNPYLKPKAGITSISTKNEGSLGVIKNTTVEFVVHNKKDFESIFLPFFMKPGATVIVDYGWSDSNVALYDVKEKVTNTDTELSEFKKFIYGGLNLEDVPPESINAIRQDLNGDYYYWKDDKKVPIKPIIGFLEDNAGLVDTIIGQVKNFNATVSQQGSFNCTIDLVSQNTTLLDQEITDENNLKFIFANQIEDTIVSILTKNTKESRSALKRLNSNAFSATEKKLVINNFFEETLDIDSTELGVLPKRAVELGFFYQNLTPKNNTSNERDLLYMSFGRFEDLFLNSLIAKTTTKKGDKKVGEAIGKLNTNFNFRNVWIRFEDNLHLRQKLQIESNEALPVFLYPTNWSSTFTTGKTKTSGQNSKPQRLYFKVTSSGFKNLDLDPDLEDTDLKPKSFPYRVKRGSGKTLFTIDTYLYNPAWGVFQEPPKLTDIIDLLSAANVNESRLNSFSTYTAYKLSEADVPTADEIIAANKKDLLEKQAKPDTPLSDGMYAINFQIPITETEQRSVDVIQDQSADNDYKTKVIPLRELFISVEEISMAFNKKQNVNDAIDFLLERINKDSYDVLKLKMFSTTTSHSTISIVDANLAPPQTDEMLVFDVTSDKSIVSDFSYNFQTPKGGFASMIAIGDKTSTKLFDEQTKDTLNFLKVLEVNKFTESPDKVYYKSLPLNTRDEERRTTEVKFDFESIAANEVYHDLDQIPSRFNTSDSFLDTVKSIQGDVIGPQTIENQKEIGQIPELELKVDETEYLPVDSVRDYYGKQARLQSIYSGLDNSISPILPIELSLTVYGNTYLNNGDIFNINFLPKAYLKRVYFQVIGVEQKLQSSGWVTSYTTLMRVKPIAKKEAVDEDRVITFSKSFVKIKLQEYDKSFIYNLMNVVESAVPLNNLPNGYNGYQINTNYSLFKKGQLKKRDEFDNMDSRVLSNSFTPATNATDFLYIYAMTKTIYSFMDTPKKRDKNFTTKSGENIIITILKRIEVRTIKRMFMKLQLGVAVASTDDGVIKNNPLRDFLQRNQKSNPAMSLEDTITNYRTNITNEFSDYIKNPTTTILDLLHSDPLDKYGGLIYDFNFKLNEYEKGKESFYLIKTPDNIKCINSLRIPYWFATPVDFIKKLDFHYKKLLKSTNNVVRLKTAWLAEATVKAEETQKQIAKDLVSQKTRTGRMF